WRLETTPAGEGVAVVGRADLAALVQVVAGAELAVLAALRDLALHVVVPQRRGVTGLAEGLGQVRRGDRAADEGLGLDVGPAVVAGTGRREEDQREHHQDDSARSAASSGTHHGGPRYRPAAPRPVRGPVEGPDRPRTDAGGPDR